jgi:hypothetical protein
VHHLPQYHQLYLANLLFLEDPEDPEDLVHHLQQYHQLYLANLLFLVNPANLECLENLLCLEFQ